MTLPTLRKKNEILLFFTFLLCFFTLAPALVFGGLVIFDGNSGLGPNIQNWSWGQVNLADYSVKDSGKAYSLSFQVASWGGIYLQNLGGSTGSSTLYLRVSGGSQGGQPLKLNLTNANQVDLSPYIPGNKLPSGNQFVDINVPYAAFGLTAGQAVNYLVIQANTGGDAGRIYISSIQLKSAATSASATRKPPSKSSSPRSHSSSPRPPSRSASPKPVPPPPPPGSSPNFGIVNRVLVDKNTGKRVLGIDRPSLEWMSTGQYLSQSDYSKMKSWGATAIRLALNQNFWLAGSQTYDANYKQTVDQSVQWILGLGMGVILDLHWSDCGNAQQSACQMPMADQRSITFWKEVASKYANNPSIMFELYNEPMQIPWVNWLHGGVISSGGGCCNSGTYNAAGMQDLYNAVRSTGANNIVIIGGINWAYDLSGVLNGYAVNGTNIVYNTHPYNYGGKLPGDWDAGFGNVAQQYPVFASEFGQYCANDGYVQNFVNYAKAKNIGWSAWAWWVGGCSFPSIISDWNGTPDPVIGNIVKTALANP